MTPYLLFDKELEISLGEFDTLEEAREFANRESIKVCAIWHDGRLNFFSGREQLPLILGGEILK